MEEYNLLNDRKKYSILFVCLGNICRSPAAEKIMQHFAQKAEGEITISAASAGLIAYHQGELPDPRMRKHAAQRGYNLNHRSRPIQTEDFYDFDLIVGMDESNIDRLHQLAPSPEEEQKICRMADFLQHHEADHIPDPYYGGANGFEHVLDLLEDACQGLTEAILKGNLQSEKQ